MLQNAHSLSEAFKHVEATAARNKTMMVYPGGRTEPDQLKYGRMIDLVQRTGGLLATYKLEPESRIFLSTRNDSSLVLLVLACLKYGHCAVISDPEATPSELLYQIAITSPDLIIMDGDKLDQVSQDVGIPSLRIENDRPVKGTLFQRLLKKAGDSSDEPPAFPSILTGIDPLESSEIINDEADAYVLFTSGTTGKSKGVRISRRALLAHLKSLTRILGYSQDSTLLNVLPMSHTDGLIHGPVIAWFNCATSVKPMRFEVTRAREIFDAVYRWKATHFILVPTILSILTKNSGGFEDSFRTDDFQLIVSSASKLDPDLWETAESTFGIRVCNLYGLTETVVAGLYCGPEDESYRRGTIGKPQDCLIRIVTDDGSEAAVGERGELLLKGDLLFSGYFGETGTLSPLQNGWFATGDLAVRDADGFISLVGRKKNLIITGGLNIEPEEVAVVINDMEGVEEAVVFGVDDKVFGEVAVALVVKAGETTLNEQDIVHNCRGRLSQYKVPRTVHFVEKLPRTRSGKIIVDQCRRMFLDMEKERSFDKTGDIREQLLCAAARVFNINKEFLSMDSEPDVTEGWDSLAHINLILELEQVFNVRFSADDIINITSLDKAYQTVKNLLK